MADWAGYFGSDYTDRNKPDEDLRVEFFRGLAEYEIGNVFEVGCNSGTNLSAIKKALGCEVAGCDINNHSLTIAESKGLEVYWEEATDLDHAGDEYDLVLTVGVMIHLNTPELIRCMKEMHRISNGLVMFLEYKGNDIEVPYRGHRGALIKRDYGGIYQALFPSAVQMGTGFLTQEMGFDDVTWWLFYDNGDSTSAYGVEETPWESDEESERKVLVASLTGTVGAFRADRPTVSSYGAGS
jgi:SAM-dependent methyltransferase